METMLWHGHYKVTDQGVFDDTKLYGHMGKKSVLKNLNKAISFFQKPGKPAGYAGHVGVNDANISHGFEPILDGQRISDF